MRSENRVEELEPAVVALCAVYFGLILTLIAWVAG